ncbi:RNA 2'-phosphotransferase [Aquimarina sp. ERC-38]|uniref:RNA 2'-phosphotransferase n=1 Tax=Aquimarina sp. ERC-38 TaxID=2949996 RepID=UPI002246946E|nr:RNA 2'-phosphotransferase [Aquimarina sp. ERC-38]UZO80658.1 RNA 2'-phosphotransferase [Aquimarina sp. ERC-38]UZO80672.1 RNA 2'-phosphotransferase [Aquimarina sp. ERC-38]
MNKKIIKGSKLISLILRHQPEKIGLTLDNEGWANVEELIRKLNKKKFNIDPDDLKNIVENNDKKRFTFSDDFTKIRANQGHSINIDLKLEPIIPPEILFHGTAEKNITSIFKKGLLKQNRNYVHLSTDIDTAKKVGMRYGKPIVLKISALKMHQENYKFYLSKNNVWLTDFVPNKFFED